MTVVDEVAIAAAVSQAGMSAPALAAAFVRLLRSQPSDLAAHLTSIEADVGLAGTGVRSHCHVVSLDVQGKARVGLLVDHLVNHILDYAIPRSRIREANDDLIASGSTKRFVRLTNEARSLFTDLATTGEGGELLLYVLAEAVLKSPQLITKMSLKTSTRMHYHGADGVHGAIDPETGILTLFWGESKIRSDPKLAITSCLQDLKPFLVSEDGAGGPRTRDMHLLSEHADLDDPNVEAAIRGYLDPDNEKSKLVRHSGVGVAGFNFADYSNVSGDKSADALKQLALTGAEQWRAHLKDRAESLEVHASEIHFFCIPMPDVDAFRATFLQRLGIAS
ncbi:MAG: DUF1837 domain-containing protein [Terricaulis sp.]